ncbi:NAD(P)H-binding protein [Bacillus sp. J37]|uniref:NAD(P)-dependent oxidoreductase n=1 Tax=Bacillus sp. J37 TaxID=935837 RepID=UPI00047C5FB4|nr:NAD(P)H-binding protein [Bacillus sp. J37]
MDHSYKIAIIGGTGTVGRHIAKRAIQQGYQVRMLVRNPERVSYKHDKIEFVQGQIQEIETIRELLSDCKVVINTFGQPTKEKPIYSQVTKNILDVMTELTITRYIGVSGGSLTISGDNKRMLNRFGAKLFELIFPVMMEDKKAEWELLSKDKHIQWTLIRLPFVKDTLKTKKIKESLTDMPGTKITNRDIATFIMEHVENTKYIHKAPFISH